MSSVCPDAIQIRKFREEDPVSIEHSLRPLVLHWDPLELVSENSREKRRITFNSCHRNVNFRHPYSVFWLFSIRSTSSRNVKEIEQQSLNHRKSGVVLSLPRQRNGCFQFYFSKRDPCISYFEDFAAIERVMVVSKDRIIDFT